MSGARSANDSVGKAAPHSATRLLQLPCPIVVHWGHPAMCTNGSPGRTNHLALVTLPLEQNIGVFALFLKEESRR